jgi:predicted ester cyclase
VTTYAGLDLDALLELWEMAPARRDDAKGAFAAVYADPTLVNGQPMTVSDLVSRAQALHDAFSEQEAEVLDVVSSGQKIGFVVRRRGKHTGTWPTPLGDLPATGEYVTFLGIDVLTVEDGRVASLWVLGDDLAVLLGAAGRRL